MPQVIVITGMHRSGTSLAASLVQRAGVNIGERLIEPSSANPRGFFEDVDFMEFHESALRSRGRTFLVDSGFAFEPTPTESERANHLIRARGDLPLWGWKDPRTSLFLDFWDSRLDGAAYLLLFRHPLDVLLSLLRRGEFEAIGLVEAVRSWEVHNSCILEFHARCNRSALVHAHGIPTRLDALNHALERKLGIDITVAPEVVSQLYRPTELRASDNWAKEAFAVLEPRAVELYEALVHAADVTPPSTTTSNETSELAAFRALAGAVLPELGSRRRGMLLTLAELVSPDVVDIVLRATRDAIRTRGVAHDDFQRAQEELRRIQEELRRIQNSKTFRYSRPLRAVYARVEGITRGARGGTPRT